jgi:hypothetical protein
MTQGLTAHDFVTEAYAVQAGDVALVHAAAGSLGRRVWGYPWGESSHSSCRPSAVTD